MKPKGTIMKISEKYKSKKKNGQIHIKTSLKGKMRNLSAKEKGNDIGHKIYQVL